MKFTTKAVVVGVFTLGGLSVSAQSNFEKAGAQAWMKGDFKNAVYHLEKAENKNPNNSNVLKMLGYSYFQCGDFDKAITTYTQLLNLKNNDYSALYYRGKAQLNIANSPKESQNPNREAFYNQAIDDFTKAMEINGEEDVQILQNRGIAYKDLGIYKSFKIKKRSDKQPCLTAFNNSISDFQKILNLQPLRKDITSLIDYVKAQITSLK